MADSLDKQWRQLSRHATIELDPKKLVQLAEEVEKCKTTVEAAHRRMQFEPRKPVI